MTEEEIQALQEAKEALEAEAKAKEEALADLERRHNELKENFARVRDGEQVEEQEQEEAPASGSEDVADAIAKFREETAANLVADELVRIGLSEEDQEKVKKELGTFVAKPNNLSEVRAQIKRAAKLADLGDPYDFAQGQGVVTGVGSAAGTGDAGTGGEAETETQRAFRHAMGITDQDLEELGPKAEARRRRNQFRN